MKTYFVRLSLCVQQYILIVAYSRTVAHSHVPRVDDNTSSQRPSQQKTTTNVRNEIYPGKGAAEITFTNEKGVPVRRLGTTSDDAQASTLVGCNISNSERPVPSGAGTPFAFQLLLSTSSLHASLAAYVNVVDSFDILFGSTGDFSLLALHDTLTSACNLVAACGPW